MLKRNRMTTRREIVSTGTLDSLNVDWKKEFDQKYADLIFKSEAKKKSKSSLQDNSFFPDDSLITMKDGRQGNFFNLSFISLTSSPVNLNKSSTLQRQDAKEDDLLFLPNMEEMEHNQQNFELQKGTPKTSTRTKKLRYSYHILENSQL